VKDMEQVPKIVERRLRAAQTDAAHPDVGLLTAFAERSLNKGERARVLGHLAKCGDCREIVSLASPGFAAGSEIRRDFPTRKWLNWPSLGWAAAAVCVAIVGGALIGRYARHEKIPTLTASMKAAPLALGDQLATTAVTPARQNAAPVNKIQSRPSPSPDNPKDGPLATHSHLGAGGGIGGGTTSPGNDKAFEISKANLAEPQKSWAEPVEVAAAPAPAAPAAAAVQNETAQLARGKAKGADAEPENKNQNLPLAGRNFTQLVESAPAGRWIVAASGAVERSLDGGKTWQVVPVAGHVVFLAISVLEGDVWVGGAGGALFHSSDGGQSWVQVKLSKDGTALTADISSLAFQDANHGRLMTTDQQLWITNDRGVSWQKQP